MKPVSVSKTAIPWSSQIARPNSPVTTDLIIAAFAGSVPFSVCASAMYAISIAPVWFPFSAVYLPSPSAIITAMRSLSGSVAISTSAPFSFPSFSASAKAFGFSGFGNGTVVKSGSGSFCSGTTAKFAKPRSAMTRVSGMLPAPLSGV